MKKLFEWLLESNRSLHILFGLAVAIPFSLLAALGAALAFETKDVQRGGRWDWLDFAATLIGGLLGQLLQAGVIILFIHLI